MRKIVFIILSLLVSSLTVYGSISIYFPSGEAEIYDLEYEDETIYAEVENKGPDPYQFELRMDCDSDWQIDTEEFDRDQLMVYVDQIKTIEIPITCNWEYNEDTDCFGETTCSVGFYTLSSLDDEESTTFTFPKPSFCGTRRAECNADEISCDDLTLVRCTNKCDDYELVTYCDYKCGYKDGERRCISYQEERDEMLKEKAIITSFWLFILGLIVILIYCIRRKMKQKMR